MTPWTVNSPGQNTRVGSLSLLLRIFPAQGSNPGLPHCRWTLYHLSHQGSPRILNWIAYPFSSGSSLHCRQSLYQLSYHKESLQFNNKDTTNQMKQWAKDLNEHFSKEDIQVVNKLRKRHQTTLIIREMQTKTIMRYHFLLSSVQLHSHAQ